MINMRPFTAFEQKNLKFLVNHNVKFTQVEITPMQEVLKAINEKGNSVSKELLRRFQEDEFKTYQNTVQCAPPNSHMLFLNVNHLDERLELKAKKQKIEDIAAWRLVKLHQRLQTKHREAFWIEVENELSDGKEFFRYKQIEHTKNPNVGQFDVLLEQNIITVDLLLCRPSGHGDTYSFKIKKKGMPLLFPESVIHNI